MKTQQGFTLLELMIAMGLGLFIIAATLSAFISTVRSSTDTIKATRLNHDVNMAVSLMSNDIKRAGYSGAAIIGTNSIDNPNPFTVVDAAAPLNNKDINIIDNYNNGNDCILYTYDANDSGSVDLDEYFGFRMIVDTTVNPNRGRLEMKLGATANTVAGGASTSDCAGGSWQTFIDNNTLNIRDLQFSFFDMAEQAATATTGYYPAMPAYSRCQNLTSGATKDYKLLDCTGKDYPTLLSSREKVPTQDFAGKRIINIRMTGDVIGEEGVVRKVATASVAIRNNRLYPVTPP